MKANYILFILCSLTCAVTASKILVIFPFPSYSHFILASRLARELARRGHEITMISPYPEKNPVENYRDISVEDNIELIEELKKNLFSLGKSGMLGSFSVVLDMGIGITNKTFSNARVQKLLNSEETFDVVIVQNFLTEALVGIAHHFGAPVIFFSPTGLGIFNNYLFGNPAPSSYVPTAMTGFSSHMTFWQRLSNLFRNVLGNLAREIYYLPKQRQLFKQYIKTDLELDDVLYNVSLLLVNSHTSLADAVPHVPNIIDIAGLHVTPPKKLPSDLQEFLDNAKDGVILFSMGSNLKSKDLSKEVREAILSAFSKIKQKVLWKFEEDLPEAPANVKIMKWLPQQDILAHPYVKAFISHGGLLSTIESVYFGVPVIGIPVFGDQKSNVAQAVGRGYAIAIALEELTEAKLSWALNEILNNPKYKENVVKRSQLIHDQPLKPIDSAIYWVEYVIRYKGAPHLRSAALDLKWYQREMVDIFIFISVTTIITIAIFYVSAKKLCQVLCKFLKRKGLSKDKKRN